MPTLASPDLLAVADARMTSLESLFTVYRTSAALPSTEETHSVALEVLRAAALCEAALDLFSHTLAAEDGVRHLSHPRKDPRK